MSHDAEHTTPVPAAGSHAPLVQWEWVFLIGVFVFALSLRLAYLAENRESPFFEHPRLDALFHDRWAESIASGNILGDEVFFRAPLYPYFLGLSYALFGQSYIIPRILHHLLGSIGVILVYLVARRLFGRATAIISSLISASYAFLIYIEGELLFEAILAPLCVAWLFFLLRGREYPSFARWLITGIASGIVFITRPTLLLVITPILLYEAWRYGRASGVRKGTRVGMALLIGVGIVVFPVTLRNYLVGGDVVLISSQGGINFYIGNNPEADGYTSSIPEAGGSSWKVRDQDYIVETALGRKPLPSEISDYWYRKGFEFVSDQPLQFFRLSIKKLYLFWNHYEIPNNHSFYQFQSYSLLLRALPIGFWFVGPLGLLGMWLACRERIALPVATYVVLYTVVSVAFFVCDRFRVPVIPYLSILSAYAIVSVAQKIRVNDLRALAKIAAIGALATFVVSSSLYRIGTKDSAARPYFSLGLVAMNDGEYAKAITYFHEASTYAPSYPYLSLSWGVAEFMLGNNLGAKEKFLDELLHDPSSYGATVNLSYVHLRTGSLDSALEYGHRAITLKPYLPNAYIYVAQTHIAKNELHPAEATLREGWARCGDEFIAGERLLAQLELASGRIDSAARRYRSILRRLGKIRQPNYEPEFEFSDEAKIGENRELFQAKALYGLAHVFVARGEMDSSVAYFTRAAATDSGFADAWADLGVAYLHLLRPGDAAKALHRALQSSPDNYLYWFNYGTALGTVGEFEKAKEAFNKVLELQPDFEPARARLQLTLKQLER